VARAKARARASTGYRVASSDRGEGKVEGIKRASEGEQKAGRKRATAAEAIIKERGSCSVLR
jgi:hypothetical protein